MVYELRVAKQVMKFLDKADANLKTRVINAFELLSKELYAGQLDIKPMVNKKGHFRLRIGDYRFLYEINKTEVFIYVYKADSRGDVYK